MKVPFFVLSTSQPLRPCENTGRTPGVQGQAHCQSSPLLGKGKSFPCALGDWGTLPEASRDATTAFTAQATLLDLHPGGQMSEQIDLKG